MSHLQLEPYRPDSVRFFAYVCDQYGAELDRVVGVLPRAMIWDWLRDWRASVTGKFGVLEALDVSDSGGEMYVLATLSDSPVLAA